jgi:hypothetical protein
VSARPDPETTGDDELGLVTFDDDEAVDSHGAHCRCLYCDPDDARDRAADLAQGP